MDSSIKGLLLGVACMIGALVASLGFFVSREASAATNNAVSQISKLNKEFADSDKTMYDGLPVSGSEVVNTINKFKAEEISIKVITKKSTTYYNRLLTDDDKELGGVSNALIKDTQVISSKTFINQKATFTGEVIRDINNTPIAIAFTQN